MKASRSSAKTPARAVRQSTITAAVSRRNLEKFMKFVYTGIRRMELGKATLMFVFLEENPGGRNQRTRATMVGGPPWGGPEM